jgi:hypothetical protein
MLARVKAQGFIECSSRSLSSLEAVFILAVSTVLDLQQSNQQQQQQCTNNRRNFLSCQILWYIIIMVCINNNGYLSNRVAFFVICMYILFVSNKPRKQGKRGKIITISIIVYFVNKYKYSCFISPCVHQDNKKWQFVCFNNTTVVFSFPLNAKISNEWNWIMLLYLFTSQVASIISKDDDMDMTPHPCKYIEETQYNINSEWWWNR